MSIRLRHEVRRLTQDEFAQIAYRVIGTLFDIHADLGRLFDEKIYQTELIQRSPGAQKEVRMDVLFGTFSKTYSLDLLVSGAIFELKKTIAQRHRGERHSMDKRQSVPCFLQDYSPLDYFSVIIFLSLTPCPTKLNSNSPCPI